MEKRKHRKRQKSGFSPVGENPSKNQPDNDRPGGRVWLYGRHPITAALANPDRQVYRLLSRNSAEIEVKNIAAKMHCQPQSVGNQDIESLLPRGAVHQGMALHASKLPEPDLTDLLLKVRNRGNQAGLIVLLDQITDPQNVGAILRSAAAFDADGVILTARNAAPESGALAKAASGALDQVPLLRVTNLARTLAQLADAGYWRYGLDGNSDKDIGDIDLNGPTALVLGAEGKGLRRLTVENCDAIIRLPISKKIDSLNVSNAAAIILYEAAKARRK